MAQSFVGEIKSRIVALLKDRWPDVTFTYKCRRWRTGGEVEVIWTDGPPAARARALLRTLHADEQLSLTRKFSYEFVIRIAKEYTVVQHCAMPEVDTFEDGTCWLYTDPARPEIPYEKIFKEMQTLDGNEIETLAYRPHLINGVWTPVRSYVLKKRDFSRGQHEQYAIVLQRSYNLDRRCFIHVRRRINENWVEVVDGTGGGYCYTQEKFEYIVSLLDERKKKEEA
jgi:hypothetical protein